MIYQRASGNAAPSFFSRNPGILWVGPWESRLCGSSATTDIPGFVSTNKQTNKQTSISACSAALPALARLQILLLGFDEFGLQCAFCSALIRELLLDFLKTLPPFSAPIALTHELGFQFFQAGLG